MNRPIKHKDKLEQNKGLIMQISIVASLLIVLLLFEFRTNSAENFKNNYTEIDLIVEHNFENENILPPDPNTFIEDTIEITINKTEAEFPGGYEALRNYFKEEMQYSDDAKKKDIQGRVIVSFTVDTLGKIKEAKVIRSIHPIIDAEALRLINNMPKWSAATKNGNKISANQTLPVMFINKTNHED